MLIILRPKYLKTKTNIKMKKIVVVALALSLFNCKQEPKKDVVEITDYKTENLDVTTSVYPENITNVLFLCDAIRFS